VVLYEHPSWFRDLFSELEARKIPFKKIHVSLLSLSPSPSSLSSPLQSTIEREREESGEETPKEEEKFSLVLNRVSAVPYSEISVGFLSFFSNFLKFLDLSNLKTLNGYDAHTLAVSKVLQYSLLFQEGAEVPKTFVVRNFKEIKLFSHKLEFPLLFKPNVGGSGGGIRKWETFDQLEQQLKEAKEGEDFFGMDGLGLLQEYHPPVGEHVFRVEILDKKLLYGLKVPVLQGSFNYCPADGCNVESAKKNIQMTPFVPDSQIVDLSANVLEKGGCVIGSVEYLTSKRDNKNYFFDVNPLSNFIKNGKEVVGLNPYDVFCRFLCREAQRISKRE